MQTKSAATYHEILAATWLPRRTGKSGIRRDEAELARARSRREDAVQQMQQGLEIQTVAVARGRDDPIECRDVAGSVALRELRRVAARQPPNVWTTRAGRPRDSLRPSQVHRASGRAKYPCEPMLNMARRSEWTLVTNKSVSRRFEASLQRIIDKMVYLRITMRSHIQVIRTI